MKKGVKTALTVFVSLVILLAVLILGFCGYLYLKQEYAISKLPTGYYKDLAKNCRTNPIKDMTDSFGCCMDSVERMAEYNYKVMPETGCPEGFVSNMLRCPSSFKWCEPDALSWKTYRNEEYGFEFMYPRDWNINIISGNEAVEFLAPDKKMRSIGIFIDNNPTNLSLEEFYNEKNGHVDLFRDAAGGYISLKIDEKSATRFKNVLGMITGDVIVIPLEKKNIRIDVIDDFDTFNQILSTFKFIE